MSLLPSSLFHQFFFLNPPTLSDPTTTSGNTGGGTTGVGTSENPARGGLDLIPIIAGVVVAVVLIVLVVLVVVLYKKVYSVRMSRAVTPIKAEQNGETAS